jgi:predicted membrane GTPase involved in stress response
MRREGYELTVGQPQVITKNDRWSAYASHMRTLVIDVPHGLC